MDKQPDAIELTSPISERINKFLESEPENEKETIEALKELSTFFIENTLNDRCNLRSKIENRNQLINDEFISAFNCLKIILDNMQKDIIGMNECVQSMTDRLQNNKSHTKQLIEQVSKLQDTLTMHQEVASAFIRTFQLTENELVILHGSSREATITDEFFTVIDRVQDIHSKCRILMQSGHQTLALDIMQQMTLFQEAGLERLYRWTQAHCRHIENEKLISLLSRSMKKLQERPILFKYTVDEYCTARRSVLVSSFIDALTLGKRHNNDSNPIEMYVHDPKRYVGDILVWLHQHIPVEKENLLILLSHCNKLTISDLISKSLSNITEGLCYPLKSRIEHIVAVEAPSTVLYSVTILIRFYQATLKPIIQDSVIDFVFSDLLELSEKSFISRLQRETRMALGERAEPPSTNLIPTPSVSRLLTLLKEVLSVASIAENRSKDMLQIVSCIIDPLLQEVNETASRLSTVDMAVYLLNCMYQINSSLALYEYMDQRLERLQAQTDAQIDTLTSEQASSLVAHLNLGAIFNILRHSTDDEPLSSIPGMDPLNIKEFMNKLEAFLIMPDVLLLPQISLLQSSNHRINIQQRAFEVIGGIYKQLYEACHDSKNLYENPNSLFSLTPDDLIKVLFIH